MRQIVQHMGSGETMLLEVPAPRLDPGCVLIQSSVTLISAGTERMLVDFSRASMVEKARQQPEKVRLVLDKVRTDGLLATMDAVRSKLDQPLPLGYCNAGIVLDVGRGVTRFKAGDRVVSNGGHAGVVSVPMNLCALIPENVNDESAVFTVLASIGLQGVRLAVPTLGETVVVIGLGLIGLMTVQLLRANGCRVLGIDFDSSRVALARQMGASTVNPASGQDPVAAALALSGGNGVDAVLITASTKSSEPTSQAARMCRKRGRIVLVGVTGLELNRSEFYEKELSFQVSCSYGPGRYDPGYEMGGNDYPLGFVRWTEQRNFEAVLSLLADGRLDTKALISSRYDIEQAKSAYDQLTADSSVLGILLEYPRIESETLLKSRVSLASTTSKSATPAASEPVVGFIGAGNYGGRILIPAFKATGARLDTVVTSTGASGVYHGRKAGFAEASTQVEDVFDNRRINTVAIVTRHNTHANLVTRALQAGKHVFVEKPLALTLDEVETIEAALDASDHGQGRPLLMVGFNRRFAPLAVKMKSLLDSVKQPKAFGYTCNAGMMPLHHWTQDTAVGGGRIVGEACHFIDLLRFLAGAPIRDFHITTMGQTASVASSSDKAIISLGFEDGSIGTIQYFANGGKVFPKERVEAFAGDAVLQLDNYSTLRGFGWGGFRKQNLWRQDKGQSACAAAFLGAVRNGLPAPIPAEELFEVARVSIRLANLQRDD
jgi:predicted dehydrogenase/threonine dehydrogenase-like Zn-dependent dehydrogenase